MIDAASFTSGFVDDSSESLPEPPVGVAGVRGDSTPVGSGLECSRTDRGRSDSLKENENNNQTTTSFATGLVTITQFYSVDVSQSRIGVKTAFSTNAQSRIVSAVFDIVLDSGTSAPSVERITLSKFL